MAGVSKTAEPINLPAETANVMRRAFTALRNGRLRGKGDEQQRCK